MYNTNYSDKTLRDYISETVRDELIQNSVFSDKIFEHSYVTGVLGISVPLNEAYPYSDSFRDLVIQEQLILEGFFADFRKLAGDVKNAALAIRYIVGDPGRIKDYVGILLKTIKDQYQKAVEWIKTVIESCDYLVNFANAIAEFAQKITKYVTMVVEKVKSIVNGIKEKITAAIKKVQGMAGWKQALLASATCVGIAFIWKKLQEQNELQKTMIDVKGKVKEAAPIIEKAKKFFAKNPDKAKSVKFEGLEETGLPALTEIIYGDAERIDEFFGSIFGKKKDKDKGKDEEGKEAEGESKEGEAKEGEGEDGGILGQIKSVLKSIYDFVKEKIMGWVKEQLGIIKDFLKSVAIEAITAAVGGGVMKLFSWMGKAFNGLKFVFEYLGPPLKKFAGMMKGDKEETPEAEAQEAMAGKDDPTESFRKDLPLLRAYVRQKLIANQAV